MESLASGRSEGAGALDEERPPLTSSEVESPPAEAGQRGTVSLHLRYHALLRRSRLLGVAFWAAMAYFIVWAVPWFPGGLTETDYTKRITLTLVIGGICALLGLGTLVLRQNLRRTTEALLFERPAETAPRKRRGVMREGPRPSPGRQMESSLRMRRARAAP